MEAERWRPAPGFEKRYHVSSYGRVHSLRWHRVMSPQIHKRTGYPCLNFCVDGQRTFVLVHQLVAAAFLGPRPEGLEVRHLDGDQLNNLASNLRYGTHAQNKRDRRLHGVDHNVNKTHCPSGHPYDGPNTYVYRTREGWVVRRCRTCVRAASRRYRHSLTRACA